MKPGEFFEFAVEQVRPTGAPELSVDLQLHLWKAMADQGCNKVVDVCESHNIPALKLHHAHGLSEQRRIMNIYHLFGRWRFFRETRYSGSRLDALAQNAPSTCQPRRLTLCCTIRMAHFAVRRRLPGNRV